ncbi:hypothetical protein ALGA_3136 [Labilibaculum antarcticum]|uniref:HTH araC/xylS-type domain-containing protein n=2 Tax=Labilibaculum antarcticum TaxID=1717717 RepID=A0A1Y1CM01_9BACT|nr:hypothetical protein ALGA_3136 [Labilibaculum antarcticum]
MVKDDSMDQVFLKKLTLVIEENLTNEQFGVKDLAKEMSMSRSQIHRKLKALTQQSISKFICEIRLKKAMELLQGNVATASEIAFRVGFRSPTYFNKCFHDYYGYPPGEVKKKNASYSESEIEFKSSKRSYAKGKQYSFSKFLIVSLLLLTVISITYFLIPKMIGEDFGEISGGEVVDKSIAVLPFKNLSEDKTNQYFADGMVEDILNRLSHIHELKVISRISSEQYHESSKSLPQIANELGVAYILEGSVQKFKNKTRIFVQLIKAQDDQHIWSERFDAEFDNLLSLQTDIAKRVASELEAVLTPDEIKQVERKQTENLEAYNLYLKGRFFWNKRTEEGVKRSLKYFEQSIILDSSYALAYAGMADAYFILAWWGWYPHKEGYAKAKEFALKTLTIDPKLAEPHATLGVIAENEWNWAEAEREFKRAIELNTNYATAHQWYAEYLGAVGKIDEAIEEINKALELDPLSVTMHSMSGVYHYQRGYYEQALALHQTVLDMDKTFRYAHIDIFYLLLQQEKNVEAVDELKKYLAKDSLDKKQITFMEEAFEKSGGNGMLLWLIDLQLAKNAPEPYFIAELYAKLGQKQKALDWLERAFEARIGLIFIRLKNDRNLENIHSEPRYKALLNKMGLEV